MLCVIGRVAVRLAIRRRLLLDDCILLFALICLSAATGLYYHFAWLLYVLNVLKYDKTVFPTVSDLKQIMNAQAINYSLVALLWSAICPVKLCFLVSFKDLIRNVSRPMLIWYWSTVGVIFVYWAIMIALPWIECPYEGTELRTSHHARYVNIRAKLSSLALHTRTAKERFAHWNLVCVRLRCAYRCYE